MKAITLKVVIEMPRIGLSDLHFIERTPTSPAALSGGIREVLNCSMSTRAKVESYNWETGEYRIVLQGTLDLDETKFQKST